LKPEIRPGLAAISRAGRDKGRPYVVLCEVDADFVTVCDGANRTMDRPKKKRRRHLLPVGREMPDFLDRLQARSLRDEEIRGFLKPLTRNRPTDPA